MKMSLEQKRKEIDKVDAQIVGLLNKRIDLAKKIGLEKLQKKTDIYDPGREEEIISRLSSKSTAGLPKESLEAIFREIFSISRKVQAPLRVAYLGPETTFTHQAALKQFGSQSDFIDKESIAGVFSAGEKDEADFGVVPIENSLEGGVAATYDLLLSSSLSIVAEIPLKIEHNLVSKQKLKNIKKVFAHPMAFAQCKEWIVKNIPNAELIEVSSTAKSVENCARESDSAGIGSVLAAKKYDVPIAAHGIQSSSHNVTRFLVLGKNKPKNSGKSKTSIAFSTKHEPGTFFDALKALKKYGINMMKIQ